MKLVNQNEMTFVYGGCKCVKDIKPFNVKVGASGDNDCVQLCTESSFIDHIYSFVAYVKNAILSIPLESKK
jgi:hypothetical protein